MSEQVEAEVRLSIRLEPEDVEVLDWLVEYVRRTAGRGVRVERSDAARWALHTCRAGLSGAEDET